MYKRQRLDLPKMEQEPSVGLTSPSRAFIRVDLPEPCFGKEIWRERA